MNLLKASNIKLHNTEMYKQLHGEYEAHWEWNKKN